MIAMVPCTTLLLLSALFLDAWGGSGAAESKHSNPQKVFGPCRILAL